MAKRRALERLELAILLYGVAFLFFLSILIPQPVSADCGAKLEAVLCQATFYPNYTAALAGSAKAKMEVNKFFFTNSTTPCTIQCLLKTLKTVITFPPITAPDWVYCNIGGIGKLGKFAKAYCFQGQCLTLADIAAIIGIIWPGFPGLPTPFPIPPIIPTLPPIPPIPPVPPVPPPPPPPPPVPPGAWKLVEMNKRWVHIKNDKGQEQIIFIEDRKDQPGMSSLIDNDETDEGSDENEHHATTFSSISPHRSPFEHQWSQMQAAQHQKQYQQQQQHRHQHYSYDENQQQPKRKKRMTRY